MKKILLLVASIVVLASCGTAQKAASTVSLKPTEQYRYDIEYVKSAGDGMSMVKVWSYDANVKVAEQKCKMNAVHGVIFKGYSGQGVIQPALVRSATGYEDNKDFFDEFFRNGTYLRYVSSTVDGASEVKKTNAKEYKVSAEVLVNVKMLRKHLEQAGIIRGLSSGF